MQQRSRCVDALRRAALAEERRSRGGGASDALYGGRRLLSRRRRRLGPTEVCRQSMARCSGGSRVFAARAEDGDAVRQMVVEAGGGGARRRGVVCYGIAWCGLALEKCIEKRERARKSTERESPGQKGPTGPCLLTMRPGNLLCTCPLTVEVPRQPGASVLCYLPTYQVDGWVGRYSFRYVSCPSSIPLFSLSPLGRASAVPTSSQTCAVTPRRR